jgi:hypothetical protein
MRILLIEKEEIGSLSWSDDAVLYPICQYEELCTWFVVDKSH